MKKLLALMLSVLFVLTVFVSCGDDAEKALTAEEIIAKTNEANEAVDSYGMDMTLDMQMSMMGQTVDMPIEMSAAMANDVIYLDMNMNMAALGQSVEMETYIDINSDPMIQYVYTEGTWIKQPVEASAAEMYKSEKMQMDLSMYAEYMKDATVVEKDYNGTACYELSGVVEIDYLELLEQMNMDSMLGDLEAAGLPENFFEEVFKDVEPFTLVLGVNKETFLLEYCNMDMTQMMDALMSSMMDMMMEQYGEEAAGFSIEIPKCIVSATYRDYNNVSLVIPEEAYAAEEIDVEY